MDDVREGEGGKEDRRMELEKCHAVITDGLCTANDAASVGCTPTEGLTYGLG
jgi:hypothetical protein